MLFPPIAHLSAISLDEINHCLRAWGHRMGPWERPFEAWFHGLHHNGELVAVTATAPLIAETCAGLTRDQAVELARVCGKRPNLCRPMVRLWREFVFDGLSLGRGWTWAVSYQHATMHTGDLYRFDGWVRLGTSHSGTDTRTGRKGYGKVIWGWSPDMAAMAQRKAV